MAPGWFYAYTTKSKTIHATLSLLMLPQYLNKSEGSKITDMSLENWWQLSHFKWNQIIPNSYGTAEEGKNFFVSQSTPGSKILWNPDKSKAVKIQAGNDLINR